MEIRSVDQSNTVPQPKKARRGFAAMTPELQREIASRGGASAHRSGVAHRFTSEEGRAAAAVRNSRRPAAGT